MNACRRIRNVAWTICAAALLCASPGVAAQLVYKEFDAAGRITYSDRPDPAAPSSPTAVKPALDVASALAASTAMSSRAAALIDANEAARRLKQAEHEREQGAERLPDEQARGANAIAMSQRYWRRQDELRRTVEQARRRWAEANRMLASSAR